MSSIKQIQPNYRQKTNFSSKNQQNYAYKQSFSGAAVKSSAEFDEVVTKVVGDINKKYNPFQKIVKGFSMFLNKHDSEIQTQAINAVFTSTLAPLMIANNPFSKKDEKTKKYTALRQPISALIAVSGGFALTSLTDNWVNNRYSEGAIKFGDIDGRMCPDKNYLKSKFKKENGIVKPFLSKQQKSDLASYIDKVQNERKALFTALIGDNPKNISINDKKQILVNGKKLGENIPNLATKEQLENYLQQNNVHNRKLADFMKDTYKFEFYDDKTIKPSTVESKLKNVNAMDFLKKMGIVGEKSQVEGMKKFDGKELAKVLKTRDDASKMSLEELFEHMNIIDKADPSKTVQANALKKQNQIQNFMNKNITEVMTKLSKPFKDKKISSYNSKAGIKEFAENIVGNKINWVKESFPRYRKYTGIFFNLFITMATCTALNWVYPRIVEKFFPELVKSDNTAKQPDSQKGGNK